MITFVDDLGQVHRYYFVGHPLESLLQAVPVIGSFARASLNVDQGIGFAIRSFILQVEFLNYVLDAQRPWKVLLVRVDAHWNFLSRLLLQDFVQFFLYIGHSILPTGVNHENDALC